MRLLSQGYNPCSSTRTPIAARHPRRRRVGGRRSGRNCGRAVAWCFVHHPLACRPLVRSRGDDRAGMPGKPLFMVLSADVGDAQIRLFEDRRVVSLAKMTEQGYQASCGVVPVSQDTVLITRCRPRKGAWRLWKRRAKSLQRALLMVLVTGRVCSKLHAKPPRGRNAERRSRSGRNPVPGLTPDQT